MVHRVAYTTALTLLVGACAHAPPRATSVPEQPALVSAALAKAAAGDTAAALDLLEQANRKSPRDPDVLFWRGKILSATTALGFTDVPRNMLAWHLLSRGAEVDPDNPRYYIELGRIRLRTPVLRIEAERMFRRALSIAETHNDPRALADVTYELGQVKERRYETSRDRYHLSTPGAFFDPDQVLVGANPRHYVKEFLTQSSYPIDNAGFVDRSEAEEYYRRGLSALPTSEPNAIGLMRLLYYQRRYQEMRDVATPLLEDTTSSPRVRMAAGLAEYRMARLRQARLLFEEGLRRMTREERNDVLGLARILRASDAEHYSKLSEAERARTDSAYWEAADPLLSTPENEGRLEFLARLTYADLRYSDADMRQTGWRTDRGMTILRYGEPPVVAAFGAGTDVDPPDAVGRIITVWYYPRTELNFVFMGPPAMNYARFAGDFRGYAEEMREDVPFLLDNLPSVLAVDTIPMQIARFRGRSPSSYKVLVAATVDARKLYTKTEADRGALELSLRMGPSGLMRLVAADTQRVGLPPIADVNKVWLREVPLSDYRVRVEARDAAVFSAAGRAQMDVAAPPLSSATLSVSDVLIGTRQGTSSSGMRGFEDSGMQPRGGVTLRKREQFALYWENYGLKPAADGHVNASVRIAITLLEIDRSRSSQPRVILGALADLVGVTREGDQTLGTQYKVSETLGGRDRLPLVQVLNLSDAPSGRYRLEIIVTDDTTREVARTQRTLYVRD